MSAATTLRHHRLRRWPIIKGNRLAFSIVLLSLSSMNGCGGGNEDPMVSPSPTVTATVTGLDPNTLYYFAVSAYNGVSGPCSKEVSTITPPSGTVSLAWDPVEDSTASTYEVHYGKQSSGQDADCTYPDILQVPVPF